MSNIDKFRISSCKPCHLEIMQEKWREIGGTKYDTLGRLVAADIVQNIEYVFFSLW